MGLIGADLALPWCISQRIVSIEGRQGGGKTLLAFKIAVELIENPEYDYGFRYIISNCPCTFADRVEDIELREEKFLDTIVILDEMGKFLDQNNAKLSKMIIADMRKLNCLIIAPSVTETQKDLRAYVIEPVLDLEFLGIDAYYYRGLLTRRSGKDKTSFWYLGTKDIKGHYNSNEILDDSQGIIPWLLNLKKFVKDSNYERTQEKIIFK
jgi:hypothetical protein